MIEALREVIKRMHYPLEVMLTCVRWYAAYPLSLRHIEEIMQERGVSVDPATVHRWALKMLPLLPAVFRRRQSLCLVAHFHRGGSGSVRMLPSRLPVRCFGGPPIQS